MAADQPIEFYVSKLSLIKIDSVRASAHTTILQAIAFDFDKLLYSFSDCYSYTLISHSPEMYLLLYPFYQMTQILFMGKSWM